jgi:hypothetical protein
MTQAGACSRAGHGTILGSARLPSWRKGKGANGFHRGTHRDAVLAPKRGARDTA